MIDFGEAKEIENNEMYDEFVGTLLYLPPEITRIRHGWELKKGDIWSIGVYYCIIVYIYRCHICNAFNIYMQ